MNEDEAWERARLDMSFPTIIEVTPEVFKHLESRARHPSSTGRTWEHIQSPLN